MTARGITRPRLVARAALFVTVAGAALVVLLAVGAMAVMWFALGRAERAASLAAASTDTPVPPAEATPATGTSGTTPRDEGHATTRAGSAEVSELRGRRLTLPVEGVRADQLVDTFDATRAGGTHEALDILAPRGTPVLAVEDGHVEKLFLSKPGGITIYQFDPSGQYAYYYAHLDRYADGLAEKQQVRRGQVIGYVGTSGNAPPNTPHLHFAVFKLGPEKHWWQGEAIDPFPIWR